MWCGGPGHKIKAEHLMRVDIRQWHQRGLLWDGGSSSWAWARGGERVGELP